MSEIDYLCPNCENPDTDLYRLVEGVVVSRGRFKSYDDFEVFESEMSQVQSLTYRCGYCLEEFDTPKRLDTESA